jgi:pilus assembly protein Flp/PilA
VGGWRRSQCEHIFYRGKIMSFINDEVGATAIEYGLLASLISVVIIGAVTAIGTNLKATFKDVANQV